MYREKLFKNVKKRLNQPINNYFDAAILGYDIYRIKNVYEILDDDEYSYLLEAYCDLLENNGLSDVLHQEINYAIKIAQSEGELEYEEMHKLFSLCDEIMALRNIGLKVDDSVYEKYIKVLRYRFSKEKKKARFVAEDLYEDWKKYYWWYSENLKSKKKQNV